MGVKSSWDFIKQTWKTGVLIIIIWELVLTPLISSLIVPPIEKHISPKMPWYDKPKYEIDVYRKSFELDKSKEVIYFSIINTGKIEMNNIYFSIFSRGRIEDYLIVDEWGCFDCVISIDYNRNFHPYHATGQELRESYCSVIITIDTLIPKGNYDGAITVDKTLDITDNEKRSMNCELKEKYSLEYSFEDDSEVRYKNESGKIRIKQLSGLDM